MICVVHYSTIHARELGRDRAYFFMHCQDCGSVSAMDRPPGAAFDRLDLPKRDWGIPPEIERDLIDRLVTGHRLTTGCLCPYPDSIEQACDVVLPEGHHHPCLPCLFSGDERKFVEVGGRITVTH